MLGVDLPPRPVHGKRSQGVTGKTSFEATSFEARLTEAKFIASGELRIVLLIPDEYAEEGATLRDAFACGLLVRIEKLSHAK